MKNLDIINPPAARPRSLSSFMAFLPVLSGAVGLALSFGAAPRIPFEENPISILCTLIMATGILMTVIPWIFRWDWKAKYFGSGLLYLGTAALFGIVPWLGIVLFSPISLISRVVIFVLYSSMIIWWCSRYVRTYKRIYADKSMMAFIYEEADDAVYFLQKSDKWALEKKIKLNQIPPTAFFVITFVIATVMLPFMRKICLVFGMPPIHIFLLVSAIPLVLLSLGLATRGYLIFYHYPRIIKKATGKDVYVDMVTAVRKPRPDN